MTSTGETDGEDHQIKPTNKWTPIETQFLIDSRRQMDHRFSISRSHKHLWEQISTKLKENGFDRSPIMCTNKWRNIMQAEFLETRKKRDRNPNSPSSSAAKVDSLMNITALADILEVEGRNKKVAVDRNPNSQSSSAAKVDSLMYITDLSDILEGRISNKKVAVDRNPNSQSSSAAKVDSLMNITDDDRLQKNLETHLEHPLAIVSAKHAAENVDLPAWASTESAGNSQQPFLEKIITVKFGDTTKRIRIDADTESIKKAIKSGFRLRTRKDFWLEDEGQVIQPIHPNMALRNYTLHVDEGMAIKVCHYDDLLFYQEEMVFYTEEDFQGYLARQGWSCLREIDGFRNIHNLDDLKPGGLYQGII